MAVPKKKVSYSRKRMRNSNLKFNYQTISKCNKCGAYKRMHYACLHHEQKTSVTKHS